MPKSRTLRCLGRRAGRRRSIRFDGLRSRWTIPARGPTWSTSQSCSRIRRRPVQRHRDAGLEQLVEAPPADVLHLDVRPCRRQAASWTSTAWGWLRLGAMARASRRSRSLNLGLGRCDGWIHFMDRRTSSSSRWRTSQTSPIPRPRASRSARTGLETEASSRATAAPCRVWPIPSRPSDWPGSNRAAGIDRDIASS